MGILEKEFTHMGRKPGAISGTPEQRLWKRVTKTESCWLWTGHRNSKGYGQIQVGTFADPKKELVHRLSWKIHYGPIPEGVFILHRCDISNCVNPDHLFPGTLADNNEDMLLKGRRHSTITLDQAIEIRTVYATGTVTMAALGMRFGIGASQVCRIVNGQSRIRI